MEKVPEKLKDAIVCAVMSEAANRFVSFLISKWWSRMSPATVEELGDSLRRLLLRVRAVVEEAEGQHITDQAILQQLSLLREEMYLGYYRLDNDTSRCGVVSSDAGDSDHVSHSFALSSFSSAKRLRVRSGSRMSSASEEELQRVVRRLQTVLETSVAEFITLSGRYPPRLCRQPYSVYLLVDKLMFGRQAEMEHVMSFLLREESSNQHLAVLPIVGPGKVGKSTLVEHACIDQRVRDRFTRIVSLHGTADGAVFEIEDAVATLMAANGPSRVLIIAELDGDIDGGSWRRLLTVARTHVACGSKMIVTSRSDSVAALQGTVLPLRLGFFSPEAYWYFFKVRTFGAMDVAEHPKLAAIAMDIAREAKGCFMTANILWGVLQSNMNVRSWSLALATLRQFTKRNLCLMSSDERRFDPWRKTEQVHVPIHPSYAFVILHNYHTQTEAQAPMATVQDVICGNVRPRGKFSLLAWKSHIPPYYTYVFNCEERSPRRRVKNKKI